jgi:polyisoprenoid-binding protein YceI
MKHLLKGIGSLIFLAALSAEGATELKTSSVKGSVEFLTIGRPGLLKIRGKAPAPQAKLSLKDGKLTGEVELELNLLDTGIELRNQHMREKYLETERFPLARFQLREAAVAEDFLSTFSNPGARPFHGQLQIMGITKEVEGKFTANNGEIQATLQTRLTDFGIETPSYLGITVAETVDITVSLSLERE